LHNLKTLNLWVASRMVVNRGWKREERITGGWIMEQRYTK
jgi:hypothetical protein